MQKKSLADEVRELMKRGYNISAIKNFLSKYGYSNEEIDSAISGSTIIRHEIHLSHTTVLVIVFILVSLLGIASFFYYSPSKSPAQLLDLNLEPVATTVEPGDNVIFIKELSNLGSSQRYDVTIKQEIIDPETARVITQKIETRAIETFGSTQTKILVPKETKKGDYLLRAVIEYDGKKAIATLPIKVTESAEKETCFDGIKNQNEGGVDCGGGCGQCEKQVIECDDYNQCTNDAIENEACVNSPIVPCCGNGICEQGEQENCNADCKKIGSFVPATETLDDIKEIARSDPAKALQQCSRIEVPDLKDTCFANIGEVQRNKYYCTQVSGAKIRDYCYSNIAKIVNDNLLCEEISIDSRKDSCYMTFVLDNKDYSVCNKITNIHLRQSCESLKQLSEINSQQSSE